ncbi:MULTISPECIES: TonB-dependent receptor domain-containing protein [unclassified Microbulbifer]|uniref:TonB-dependent receptor plug domain-containing protein n=1 Tax=unclassified Microbulbifer TaxID=2619833 RepID=UPI0027E5705E|nr:MULTISPECIES: TonB-dependent receptor [unclassified Microbulbifer]
MKKSILTAAVAAVSSAPVAAQTIDNAQLVQSLETPNLETVVVVSSRREMPLRQVATSVAAMDEAQIEARGFTALADVLRAMPSVSVSNSGGMGKASSLRVRGEAGFRTLVRIDGVDVSDPTGLQASAPIQHILSSNVSRVELLRGPQGMMYGADAGGVLNISTRSTGEDTEVKIATEGGSFGSQRYSASLGGGHETVDYFVSATRADTDGFNTSLGDKELRDDDGYKNTTLHARGGWNISDSLRLEAVARDTEASNEFDRCGFPVKVDDCTGDFDQTNARVSMTHKTGILENQLAYSRTEIARKNFAGGAVSYDTEGEIEKLNLTGRADLSDVHALVYGLEQREDSVGELERDQWALYAEYQGNYADTFYLTAGVRRDDNDDFGHHDSLRLSGAYLIDAVAAGSLKLKTSYGTGFRAPSLFEIDYNRQQRNPDLAALSPEESEGIDVGVEYFGNSGLHLEAVLFDQRVDHEIGFDLVNWTYIQSEGESRSRGVELIADTPLTDTLVLNTNYTYTDAEDAADSPRARMPEHMANIGFTYVPVDALSASLNLRAARGAVDTSGEAQDNYQVLDASLRYTLNPSVTVYLRGENLTDKSYVEVSGFRTAGASGYAGVEVTF